jgi:hypothetical protein
MLSVFGRLLNSQVPGHEQASLVDGHPHGYVPADGATCCDGHEKHIGRHEPETFVPQRLEAVGLDPDYIREVMPDTLQHMLTVCGTCDEACRCEHDLKLNDAGERLAKYCPNAALIDELIVQKGF